MTGHQSWRSRWPSRCWSGRTGGRGTADRPRHAGLDTAQLRLPGGRASVDVPGAAAVGRRRRCRAGPIVLGGGPAGFVLGLPVGLAVFAGARWLLPHCACPAQCRSGGSAAAGQ